jgi:Trypsin-like peptidase domain
LTIPAKCETIYSKGCRNRGESMTRISASILLSLVLLLSGGVPRVLADWSISKISERYAPAVVKIVALDEKDREVSSGSGFFVNNRGFVATNHHVLERASGALVQTAKGKTGEVLEIVRDDPGVDLVIARTSLQDTLPVAMGDSDKILVGESVLLMGNSPGWEGTLSSGMITHIRRAGDLKLIQISAPILPGCSGGPVFSVSGEVIAVATAFLDSADFAIPVNYLKNLRPKPSPLSALKEPSVKFDASLVDKTLVDLLVEKNPDRPPARTLSLFVGGQNQSLTVYFKSGRKLLCDRVWKNGRTLFLVVHGRRFAVGYDEDLINMKKSLL